MENKVVINGDYWRFCCPKCGNTSCECGGEDVFYNYHTAELNEYCHCEKCGTHFTVVSDMVYKHTIIDE